MSFRLEEDPISAETRALAIAELRETEENVKNGLEELKKLLEADKTIFFDTKDNFLLIFLRPCKFYPQSAYALMKRIADFKEKNAALLDNLLPQDEKVAFLDHNVVNVLKHRDHKGRRVMIVNAGKTWDPSKVDSDQMFRIFYLIHEAAMLEPETQVRGVVVIMDFEGLGMKQVMGLNPAFSLRLLTFIQEAMPLRLKEIHIVKEPYIFNIVWAMFKPLIKEKLKRRMYLHGSKMSSLHKHMDPSHLPENYGGKLPAIDYSSADWYPVICENVDKVTKWNSYGIRKNPTTD